MFTEDDFLQSDHENAIARARELLALPNLVVLDTETTGLGPAAEVVQVSVIDGQGNTLLDTLVKPTVDIEPAAQRIHGISKEMVEDAPGFGDVYLKLFDILLGKTVLIYNADFDLRLLRQSARAIGLDWGLDIASWCVMQLYAVWYGDWSDYHQSYKWQKLPEGDHSALGDCKATLALLRKMAGMGGENA